MTEQGLAPVQRRTAVGLSLQRLWGMMLRHWYILRSSVPRLLELCYWPTFQLLLWGFITTFLLEHSSWIAQAAGVLISAVLLWDVLFRSNIAVSIMFLEEMWARNLAQIFISPLRPLELIGALMAMSFLRTLISILPAAFLALPFFGVWVFDLGFGLIAFFFNLMVMGWSFGILMSGMIMRLGLGAESLAWLGVFLIAPITGIYYPVAVLPEWLQPLSWALPSTYVFEGMRAVLFDNVFRWDLMAGAIGLNVVFLVVSTGVFLYLFGVARNRGLLLQQGE